MKTTSKTYTRPRHNIGTGTISLLVIFTVLFFSALALQSLLSANNDRRMNQRGFQAVQNMAIAEGEASEKLAEVDAFLADLHAQYLAEFSAPSAVSSPHSGTTAPDDAFYRSVSAGLSALGLASTNGGKTIDITTLIDQNNVLITEISVLLPGAAQRFVVRKQYSKMVGKWQPGEGGTVWGG